MYKPDILVRAIVGSTARTRGGCCMNPQLREIMHPTYRCDSCHQKIKMVKKTIIEITVLKE